MIDFLTMFANENDECGISEQEAYACLPRFLPGAAITHYETAVQSSGGANRLIHGCLLKRYVTSTAIKSALVDRRRIKQGARESEEEYRTDSC